MTSSGLYGGFAHPEGETFLSLAWLTRADRFAKKNDEAKMENSVYFKNRQVHQIDISRLPKASWAYIIPADAACMGC